MALVIYVPKALATDVSGALSSDTTWEASKSPYVVTGAILVEEGVTLTVEAGVEVRFEDDTYIKVNGEVVARGTSSGKIRFTSSRGTPAKNAWGYIRLIGTSLSVGGSDE